MQILEALVLLHGHGIGEISHAEERHAINVRVQAVDVAVLVAPPLHEHLRGERLPRRVRRPVRLVLRALGLELRVQIIVCIFRNNFIDVVAELLAALHDVQHVRGQVRRLAPRALARPEGEAAVAALELIQLVDGVLRRGVRALRVDARQRERVAEVRGEHERHGGGGALLRAAVGVVDEVLRAASQADHRGRRELDVQPPRGRRDILRNLQPLVCSGGRSGRRGDAAVRGERLGRREHAHRQRVLERVALAVERDAHLDARRADGLRRRVEAHFGRAVGSDVHRALCQCHAEPRRRRSTQSFLASGLTPGSELHDLGIERLDGHRCPASLLELAVHHAAEQRLVAEGQEARPRRREQHRLVDADLVLGPAEARDFVARHGHDAIRRQ